MKDALEPCLCWAVPLADLSSHELTRLRAWARQQAIAIHRKGPAGQCDRNGARLEDSAGYLGFLVPPLSIDDLLRFARDDVNASGPPASRSVPPP